LNENVFIFPTHPVTRRANALSAEPHAPAAPTLVDVAREAGVSLATASRVFGSPQLVREDTARRVQAAASSLGFRPNLLGAKLRAQRTRILGVMLPTLENAVFAECWRGIEETALAANYSLMLVTSRYEPARERERVEYLLRHRVDGLVLTVADAARSAVLTQLDDEGVPYVLAYNQASQRSQRYSVSVDNRASARAGVEQLIALGHRRIAVVSGAFAASDRARQRHAGYQDAMDAHGLALMPPVTLPGHVPSPTLGDNAAVGACVRGRHGATALFCTNDMLAIGVMSELKRLGLSVPRDVSVLGYDGIALGHLVEPKLATVVQPNHDIGTQAVAALVARLDRGTGQATRSGHQTAAGSHATLLPHALRPGGTVAAPRAPRAP
jgi:DNA-binding LacI/PurR family transcriptional regulator